MRARALLLAVSIVTLTVAAARAHHAFSPVYDAKRTVVVDGVVTQFRFVNPHAMLLIDVTDSKTGKVVKWNVEFAGRLNLEEAGWTRRVDQGRRAREDHRQSRLEERSAHGLREAGARRRDDARAWRCAACERD